VKPPTNKPPVGMCWSIHIYFDYMTIFWKQLFKSVTYIQSYIHILRTEDHSAIEGGTHCCDTLFTSERPRHEICMYHLLDKNLTLTYVVFISSDSVLLSHSPFAFILRKGKSEQAVVPGKRRSCFLT
jgi:hypothetical protein